MGSEEIPSTVTASSVANLLTQLSHNSIKAKVGIGMKVNSGMEEWWVLLCLVLFYNTTSFTPAQNRKVPLSEDFYKRHIFYRK